MNRILFVSNGINIILLAKKIHQTADRNESFSNQARCRKFQIHFLPNPRQNYTERFSSKARGLDTCRQRRRSPNQQNRLNFRL